MLRNDEWHRALNRHLFPAVRLDRALLPAVLGRGSGVIIHITAIQRQLSLHEPTIAYPAARGGALELQQGSVQGGECPWSG
jgi:NAD(P)-dependent dehydrogenase (short-subunit alcohol dehydrogenase family)